MTNDTASQFMTGRRNGGARKHLETNARRIITEYREGRAASACMADLERAVAEMDRRKPARQDG